MGINFSFPSMRGSEEFSLQCFVQINEFKQSNVIVPYNGPILPYYGIGPTQSKWIFLGYEAVSPIFPVVGLRIEYIKGFALLGCDFTSHLFDSDCLS